MSCFRKQHIQLFCILMRLSNIFGKSVPTIGLSKDPWPILARSCRRQHYYIRATVTIINAANIPPDAIRNATCDLRHHNTRTSSLNERIVPRSLISLRTFLYNILLICLCSCSHSSCVTATKYLVDVYV